MGEHNNNQNNFNGFTNFNGTTQFATGDVINNYNVPDIHEPEATYNPEPVWRSPFTMAVLTWISFAISIGGLFPVAKILKTGADLYQIQIYIIMILLLILLFVVFFSLRRIAKDQTRYPLVFNYAISGFGNRITLEKIHVDGGCPQCGGKMKFYNKPVEWNDILFSNGRSKRQITKRVPVLECKRNKEDHCYRVDPAEDRVQ